MKHIVSIAIATSCIASLASAQIAMRPRPTVTVPATNTVPAVVRPGGLGNAASRLQPTPFLGQSEFRTLIGEVGTPNDFDVPAFTTSFKITPLAPTVAGKGKLATGDAFAEPDGVSEIVGGGAVINATSRTSYAYGPSASDIRSGGAELTINALRGEAYAVNCLASVNDNPNALIYYSTSNPTGTGPSLPETSVALKDHHFVTLVKRTNQNGDIKIFLRPQAVELPTAGLGSRNNMMGGLAAMANDNRRAKMTPEERAAEDAANAAANAAKAAQAAARYTMKLWGCQVSSAN